FSRDWSSDVCSSDLGYDHDDEGEYVTEEQMESYTGGIGGDRVKSLGLHQHEIDLIKAVGPVNKNSVVVMIGGNMIMMTEWKDDRSEERRVGKEGRCR